MANGGINRNNKYQRLNQRQTDDHEDAGNDNHPSSSANSLLRGPANQHHVPSALDYEEDENDNDNTVATGDDNDNGDSGDRRRSGDSETLTTTTATRTTAHSSDNDNSRDRRPYPASNDSYVLETIELSDIYAKDRDGENGVSVPPPPSYEQSEGATSHSPGPIPSASTATAPGEASQTGQGQQAHTTDGVFSNIAAKPDLYMGYENGVPSEPLPSYNDIYGRSDVGTRNVIPPYFEPAVVTVSDDDELLIEGLPVGSFVIFLVNLAVSAGFQFIGFMMTFLLHTTHAAKCGSLTGLGITFILYGFYMQDPFDPQVPKEGEDSDIVLGSMYLTYVLIVIGWLIMLKGIADYVRVRRLQAIIESSPEENV